MKPRQAFRHWAALVIGQGCPPPDCSRRIAATLTNDPTASGPFGAEHTGLHLLLRFSRRGKVDRSSRTPRMVLATGVAAKWQQINPTERYFSLLERWWSFADFAQDGLGLAASTMAEFRLDLPKRCPLGCRAGEPGKTGIDWQHGIFRLLGMRQVALMQLFGLLDIVSDHPAPGEGWRIKRLVATPWGPSTSSTYLQTFGFSPTGLLDRLFNPAEEDSSEEEELRFPFFVWADAVFPFFPQWRNSLQQPDAVDPFRDSVTFKVSLGASVWRRIVMPAESDFSDLARFILDAFGFDDDHLYQFPYQDEYATPRTLDDPRCCDVEEYCADELSLGEVGLFPRQLVEFRYDFGDDWRFDVLVEKLDPSETGAKPALLGKQGKAPRQYG